MWDLIVSVPDHCLSFYFASYLEDYLMEKCCTWDNGSVRLKD